MDPLFFYGTLRYAPLLNLVLGRVPDMVSARLAGHQVRWAGGESFPMILEGGDGVEGLLVRGLTAGDRARLDHYEGAFAYRLRSVTVETPEGSEAAAVYFPDPGAWRPAAPWILEDWVRDWGALTLIAAAEVMALYGREDPTRIGKRFGMIRSRAQSRVRNGAWTRPRSLGPLPSRENVQIDAVSTPYSGFFTVEEYCARHLLFDGSPSDPVERAVFGAADAVTVLPYDPRLDRVLMIEQLRLGAYAQGDPSPWLLEPIAGIIDAGESPETTARREAEEEAGVTLGDLHLVGRYYPSPGGLAQVLISYVAICDLPDGAVGLGGKEDEGEDIRSHLVSLDQAAGMLESGELAVAPLIMSVQWLMLHRDRLRAPS